VTETDSGTNPATGPADGESTPSDAAAVAGLLFEKEGGHTTDSPAMETPYQVDLEIFEGPLDLLLFLIKKDEVDIYDISIERITEQYLAYIDTFKLLNIGLAGEFLVMAATLCYIKSRMMLPKHVQPPDEDIDEEDPRWDLIKQLIEYKKFKDAAASLGQREEKLGNLYRNFPDKIESDSAEERRLSEDINIFDLIRAFQNILDRFNDGGVGEIIDDHYTVSDKIDFLLAIVQPGKRVSFNSLFDGVSSKGELIVTFLAMLELMKLNHFRVRQDQSLGEIELERNVIE